MSTIDGAGNIHRGAGAPGGGQFAGKVNSAPAAGLVGESADMPGDFIASWDGPPEAAREAFALASWSVLSEPGDGTLGRVIRALGADEALSLLRSKRSAEDAANALGVDPSHVTQWRSRDNASMIADVFQRARRANIRIRTAAEGGIPAQFDDLGDTAPLALWTLGDQEAIDSMADGVSIVGARASTSYGEHVTSELAAGVASGGQVVVSGGAYGVDAAAHRAALTAGGRTVSFLAGGVDRPYPQGNADMLARVAANGGALISETPPGSAPTKWRFLARNRLIAAATSATVVVEAGVRSGSVHTATECGKLGRPVGAVPGPVTSPSSSGTNLLIRDGVATAVMSVDDITALAGTHSGTVRS